MGRKHLLSQLAEQKLTPVNSESSSDDKLRETRGVAGNKRVIGAVSRSIEHIRAQGVIDLDPNLVDPPIVADRIDVSHASLKDLTEQMREHGQQVPILVRPKPGADGRYQIVYGWRRTQSAITLGIKVRASVKQLSDDEVVIAQGQENNSREDLSFIEKALYAVRLENQKFGRDVIMAALAVDKTVCSRLISTAKRIPPEIIEAIGPAPKAGRNRWLELAEKIESKSGTNKANALIQGTSFSKLNTDERFNRLFSELSKRKSQKAKTRLWKGDDGRQVAKIRENDQTFSIVIEKQEVPEFSEFLANKLPEIYEAFVRQED